MGKVCGKSFDDHGFYGYSVFMYDLQEVWCFDENELESTGKFADPDEGRSGETIKVFVNEKGEGFIRDEDD